MVKTPLDLQGIGSRDLGVSIEGPINKSKSLGYRFMVGNGLDTLNVQEAGLKWQGAISWNPLKRWYLDFYLDYEKLDGHEDRSTFQLFVGYREEKLRWGLQYSNQYRQSNPRLELISAFITGKVYNNISLIGRVDRLLEPSPRGNDIEYIPFDPNSKATFFIGGIEFPISKHFIITPNVVFTTYDESNEGIKSNNDLQYRLSLFFNFEE